MGPVGSHVNMSKQLVPDEIDEIGNQFILRRICATNWFSGDILSPVGVGQVFCDQLVFTQVGARSWVSVKCVQPVSSHLSMCECLRSTGSQLSLRDQSNLRRLRATIWFSEKFVPPVDPQRRLQPIGYL